MAEETLRYNIEFDREALAQQLESIRQEIDVTLSAAATTTGMAGGGMLSSSQN